MSLEYLHLHTYFIYASIMNFLLCSVSSQNFGDLQFVGFEASKLSGLLEFNFGGLWFTICNDGFGLKEAAVACRQLGLGYPVTVFNQDEGKNESQYHR